MTESNKSEAAGTPELDEKQLTEVTGGTSYSLNIQSLRAALSQFRAQDLLNRGAFHRFDPGLVSIPTN